MKTLQDLVDDMYYTLDEIHTDGGLDYSDYNVLHDTLSLLVDKIENLTKKEGE